MGGLHGGSERAEEAKERQPQPLGDVGLRQVAVRRGLQRAPNRAENPRTQERHGHVRITHGHAQGGQEAQPRAGGG